MMKLSTLWSLDRTIDPATGRNPVADRIAAHWPHDPGTVRFFRSSANFIYILERNGQRAYLRLATESERSRKAIEAELSALHHLRHLGVCVVTPRPTPDGEFVVSQQTGLGVLHAVLFDALPGELRSLDQLSLPYMTQPGPSRRTC